MHVTSTLNSDTEHGVNVPLAIFRHEGNRKFVVKTGDYKETIENAKTSFGLSRNTQVTLSTTSLNVCQGHVVEIDELAYPHLWKVLDEVSIITTQFNAAAPVSSLTPAQTPPAVAQPTKGKNKAPTSSTRPSLLPPPTASTSTESHPPLTTDEEEEHNLDTSRRQSSEEAYEAGDVSDTDLAAALGDLLAQVDDNLVEEELLVPAESVSVNVQAAPSVQSLFDDDAEVEEMTRLEQVEEEEVSAPSTPSPKTKKPRSVRQPAPEATTATTSTTAKRDRTTGEPKKPKTTKPSTSSAPRVVSPPPPSRRAPAPPAPSSSSATTDIRTSTKTIISTKQVSARPQEPAAVSADENTRFTIAIQGPGEETTAQFKMRSKHPIYKILKTACVNFGLDFDSATLWLVNDQDEDAEPQFYELERDKTAAHYGLKEGSTLVIQMDDAEEEGEEEEEYEDDRY